MVSLASPERLEMGNESLSNDKKFLPIGAILLYLVISVIILFGGYFLYRTEEQHLRETREKELSAIARLKVDRIREWRDGLRTDAEMFNDNRFFKESLVEWMEEEDPVVTERIMNRINTYGKFRGYRDILLVDLSGKVRISLSGLQNPLNPEIQETFQAALRGSGPVLTDLYRETEDASPQLDVITPLVVPMDGSSKVIGAAILRADPSKVLFPLIQSWPTESDSAETLLVQKMGDQVVYLNELRHWKGTALKLRIPLEKIEVPAVQGVLGRRGTFVGMDYRGIEVLSAIEPVPDSPWIMISKVDVQEAFSAWRERSRLVLALILVLLVGAFAVFASYWQRQRSHHYRALYRVERERLALLKHFEYLVKYANDIILLADQDARIIEANDRALSAYGYTLEELRQLTISNLVVPEKQVAYLENLQKSRQAGSTLYETIHQKKDGSRFDVEVSTQIIEIDGIPYIQKIIRDITERKYAQEKLEQSERKYRLMFENLTSGFALHRIVTDDQGHPVDYLFVEVNPAFEQLTGLMAETVVGRRVLEVLPTLEERWIERYGRIALSGESQRFEDYNEELQKYFDILAYSTEPGYFAVIFSDITERKLAEKARDGLLKNLQEKTEEMESLLYVSSHDLRTPLVNIQGFGRRLEKSTRELTELLDHETDPSALRETARPILHERIPSALGYIVASANKMDSLISGLLRISRLGRVQLNATRIDMNRLIESVLASQEYQIRQAGATTTVGRLPSCWGDPSQINQVFSNLVENALKYGKGRETLSVRIHGETEGDMAVYCVEDSGPGIKREYQEKVWGLFSRLDPGGKVEGEGLGLTVVKRIVQRHRGKVWLESELDQGSRFFVALPRKTNPGDAPSKNPPDQTGENEYVS